MIPAFAGAGNRVTAPDFFGFGRSDKPVKDEVYTFDFHRNSLIDFIETLDLKRITLVCQDWGGLLGLTIPMDLPDRFDGVLLINTALGTGDAPLTEGFVAWRAWSNAHPDMAVGRLLRRSCAHLSDAEAAAYDAPFPDARFKVGVRRFPNLVPDRPDAPGAALSRRARTWWQHEWHGRSFMRLAPPIRCWASRLCCSCGERSEAVPHRWSWRTPVISFRSGETASRPRRSKHLPRCAIRARRCCRVGLENPGAGAPSQVADVRQQTAAAVHRSNRETVVCCDVKHQAVFSPASL
jgi:pimeloyl-ACP methyl ester carboxylesterase